MSDFLATMAQSSRARARRLDESELSARIRNARPPVPLTLTPVGFDLIAEVKPASPTLGRLIRGDEENVAEVAVCLSESGARALSVLTEPDAFAGTIGHLEAIARRVTLPVMRKDFPVDPLQVVEARAAGASGVLLIARILDPPTLVDMTDLAIELGLFVLVELFDPSDVERASVVFDRRVLIGVNARDLDTLALDPDRHAHLAPLLPAHLPAVAESGVITREQAAAVARLGYRLALVGTSLMSDADPAGTARALITAGRKAAASGSAT